MLKSISVSYLKTLISSKIINLLRFRGKDTKIIYDTCFHSSWTLSINGCPFSLHKNQHLGLCRACSIQGLSAAAHSDRPTLQQKHRTTSLSPAIYWNSCMTISTKSIHKSNEVPFSIFLQDKFQTILSWWSGYM
jgi:hypothetical protein